MTSINTPVLDQPLRFNPFDLSFRVNPYPLYQYLRTHEPVQWGLLGGWALTRYADVKMVMRDTRFYEVPIPDGIRKKGQYLEAREKNLDALAHVSGKWLFFLDPPNHTRMRSLVTKAFKPGLFQQMREQIQAQAEQLIEQVKPQGQMDIISDFAEILPTQVIMQVMGLPEEDFALIRQWSRGSFRIFDPLISLKTCEGINQIALEFVNYLRGQVTQRRKQPQADFISALLAVEDDGEKLSEDEILGTCIMMAAAGERTTTSAIGNSMLALLQHPDQLQLLRQHPEILPSAIEELLRYDSPTQLVARMATETLELGGKTIEAGDYIILCIGSANRDPAQFPDPDRLDLRRTDNQHIAFASGIHFCVGAGLARLELPMAIQALVQHLPNLKLATDELTYQDNVVTRFLSALPVTFGE